MSVCVRVCVRVCACLDKDKSGSQRQHGAFFFKKKAEILTVTEQTHKMKFTKTLRTAKREVANDEGTDKRPA